MATVKKSKQKKVNLKSTVMSLRVPNEVHAELALESEKQNIEKVGTYANEVLAKHAKKLKERREK